MDKNTNDPADSLEMSPGFFNDLIAQSISRRKKPNKANDLQPIIDLLANRIQWMVDNTKISAASLKIWESIHNKLVDFYEYNEAYIEQLQDDKQAIFIKYDFLQEYITKLEAIILIHGITNVNKYLSKPTELLVEEAEKANKEGWTQLPAEILYKVEPSEIQKLLTK